MFRGWIKKNNLNYQKFWGYFFIFFVILDFLVHLFYGGFSLAWDSFFWSCNILAILLSYGLLRKKGYILWMVTLLSILSQFQWIIKQLKFLFTGSDDGRIGIMFSQGINLGAIIAIISHFVIFPVALWYSLKFKFSQKVFLLMYLYTIILLPLSYFVTNKVSNVNCLNFSCDLDYYLNSEQIKANSEFLTTGYFVKEVLYWIIVVSISYLLYRIYLLFLLSKKNNYKK